MKTNLLFVWWSPRWRYWQRKQGRLNWSSAWTKQRKLESKLSKRNPSFHGAIPWRNPSLYADNSVKKFISLWGNFMKKFISLWGNSVKKLISLWGNSVKKFISLWGNFVKKFITLWGNSVKSSIILWGSSVKSSIILWGSSVKSSIILWDTSVKSSIILWGNSVKKSIILWGSSVKSSIILWGSSVKVVDSFTHLGNVVSPADGTDGWNTKTLTYKTRFQPNKVGIEIIWALKNATDFVVSKALVTPSYSVTQSRAKQILPSHRNWRSSVKYAWEPA